MGHLEENYALITGDIKKKKSNNYIYEIRHENMAGTPEYSSMALGLVSLLVLFDRLPLNFAQTSKFPKG